MSLFLLPALNTTVSIITYRTDGAFLPWSLDLKSHLFESYPLPESLVPISDEEFLEPRWTLTLLEGKELYSTSQSSAASDMAPHDLIKNQQANVPCVKDPLQHNESDPATDTALPPTTMLRMHSALIATVTENSRQTSQAHWQDVRHISLVVDKKLDYQPGDIINIYPKNFPEDVNSLLKLQNWERFADIPLTFIPNATSYHKTFYQDSQFIPGLCKIPTTNPCTLRSLLLNNLDIAAIPRRYFFDVISKFCSDETHRARLQEFSNPVFTDEFFDFATRPRRSCLEVLQDFPTVQVPFKYVLALFQPLRRRQFSIASGGVLKKESGFPSEDAVRIDILVAIVKYRTVLKKIRQGVCSRYLSTLKPGTDIAITLERGSFPPLRYLGKPILLIATGTGVAPMRSILHERAYQRIECREKVGSATLIFGGRNKNADYFYRKEWEQRYLDVQIFCAWSRDQREKIYVQDIIQEQSLLIHRLLVQEGGSVFVCGSSGKMPTSVRAALVDAFAAGGSVTKEIAEGWLAAMEKQSRYVQETW